jgi:hypothetical protein
MTHIFYIGLIIFIIYEVYSFLNEEKINTRLTEYKDLSKDVNKEYFLWKNGGFLIKLSLFNMFYFIYVFVGIFSSQWLLFLAILLLSLIPKKTVAVRRIDSVLTIIILLFILINKYHLHINLF